MLFCYCWLGRYFWMFVVRVLKKWFIVIFVCWTGGRADGTLMCDISGEEGGWPGWNFDLELSLGMGRGAGWNFHLELSMRTLIWNFHWRGGGGLVGTVVWSVHRVWGAGLAGDFDMQL